MKTLLIVAVAFFAAFGGLVAYLASAGPGHDYDLNYVLPIDVRSMPHAAPSVGGSGQPRPGRTDPETAQQNPR